DDYRQHRGGGRGGDAAEGEAEATATATLALAGALGADHGLDPLAQLLRRPRCGLGEPRRVGQRHQMRDTAQRLRLGAAVGAALEVGLETRPLVCGELVERV